MITNADLRELIAQIKKATGMTQRKISEGAGYAEDSLSELLAQKNGNCEPAYKQLQLVYAEELKNSMPGQPAGDNPRSEHFTADQLFAMYMKAMERQDNIMAAQTALLKSIESKMAQEKTQAKMVTNLKNVARDVTMLVERQYMAVEEIRDQFSKLNADKESPSKGVRKIGDQSGDSA